MQLTFGVELEFIVRFRLADYEPARAGGEGIFWHPSQRLTRIKQLGAVLRAHVITILQEAGLDVNDVQDKANYQKWTVDTDGSISWDDLPLSVGLGYYGIEVKSPAFYYSDWALTQIQKVVILVRSNFEVFVNESCALHVHVGNCHAGFPLQTLKNFCMLATVFERQFDMLHPLHRLTSPFARRVAGQFPLMAPLAKAQTINGFETIGQLTDCYHLKKNGQHEGYMAYNFLNLTTRPLRTIEFRQHAGSLDPEATTRWAQLATSLVMSAHDVGVHGFAQLIYDHSHDSDYSITDLLQDLNLYDLAAYYRQRGIHRHPKLEWDWDNTIPEAARGNA